MQCEGWPKEGFLFPLAPTVLYLNAFILEPSFLGTFMSWDFTEDAAFMALHDAFKRERCLKHPPWSSLPMVEAPSTFQELQPERRRARACGF